MSKNTEIKVSVIVPVYNTEKYLIRCLESLVNQTLNEMEVLVVDDGSTDSSPLILEKYIARFPDRIRVIHKENGGQATARNMGIREARGKYIGFTDSDDYVDNHMFEEMLKAAESEDCDMVECNYHYIQDLKKGTQEIATRGNIRQYKNQKDMFIDPMTVPWSRLVKREILQKEGLQFPEGLIYEDTAFCIKMLPYIKKEKYVDKQLYYYILREGSTMTANKSRKVADIFAVLEDILDFYRREGFYEEYAKELEYFCVKILLCSSLSRVGRIPDSKLRNQLLDKTFEFIHENFPDYKQNAYFNGKIGTYIKHINRPLSGPVSKLFGRIMKG